MKKILTLAFALLCMVSVFAANVDIIIKTNSEKIEALIQEVSDSEIKYKKANNPNGPMFIVKTDDVASIIYANGEVQAIEHKAQPAPQPQQNYGYGYGMTAAEADMLQRIGSNEYLINGQRLKGKELTFFLEKNCPEAYNYYRKWNNCEVAGWCLLSFGVAFAAGIGVTCYMYGIAKKEGWREMYSGIAFMAAGGAMTVASIPLIACGNINKKAVTNVYNEKCRNKSLADDVRLNVISNQNGLGLAIAF